MFHVVQSCPMVFDILTLHVGTSKWYILQNLYNISARRKWQNSKHSSRSPWVQTLKDLMRNVPGKPIPPADPDAETERLSGSHDDGDSSPSRSSVSSNDPVPDNFMGVPDAPPHDTSSDP